MTQRIPRARALVSGTDHLAEGVAGAVVDAVADAAPVFTVGQLAARLATATIEADHDDVSLRFARAVEDRWVVVHPTLDGTGSIIASDLPPTRPVGDGDGPHQLPREVPQLRRARHRTGSRPTTGAVPPTPTTSPILKTRWSGTVRDATRPS
jgi:hypothetical protein